MSLEIVVIKKPAEIEEYHTLMKWIDKAIERSRPSIKSFFDCDPNIQTLVKSISPLLPVLQIFPADADLKTSPESQLSSWMNIHCCAHDVVNISFNVGGLFGKRKLETFEKTLCKEAEKLGLYVVYDREILVGGDLKVDSTKAPEYREEKAKDRIKSKMPELSEKFAEHIRTHIELSSPIEFEFTDHMHHPHIAIKCTPQDFGVLYGSFDKFRPGLFKIMKTLKGISGANVGFQIIRKS